MKNPKAILLLTPCSRRDFMQAACASTLVCIASGSAEAITVPTPALHEASFYDSLENGMVRCRLCLKNALHPTVNADFAGSGRTGKAAISRLSMGPHAQSIPTR